MQMNKERVLILRSDLGSSFSLDVGLYLGSDAGLDELQKESRQKINLNNFFQKQTFL